MSAATPLPVAHGCHANDLPFGAAAIGVLPVIRCCGSVVPFGVAAPAHGSA